MFSQWKDALLVVSKALSAHSTGHLSLTGGRQGKVIMHSCRRPLRSHNLMWECYGRCLLMAWLVI